MVERTWMRILLAVVLVLRLAVAPAFAADVYVIDRTQSEAKFEISYLLSTVAGRLKDISGTINLDWVNPSDSSVKFTIKVSSVETGSSELDQLLCSPDFLNTKKFSQITFQSTHIQNTAKANVYQVVGELTLRGVTRPVRLWVNVGGAVRAEGTPPRAAFLARTTLNRRDYGMNWSKLLDQGVIVGDDLRVTVNLVALKQPLTALSE
jgi:polyisoprenoid-binding protein YceI